MKLLVIVILSRDLSDNSLNKMRVYFLHKIVNDAYLRGTYHFSLYCDHSRNTGTSEGFESGTELEQL